jgi:uncharacterized membrane protein YjjP (DUF1212 family)
MIAGLIDAVPLDENLHPDLVEKALKKKFIFRLVTALHSAGSYGFRTEKFANRVSNVFKMCCTATMFPNRVIIAFHEPHDLLNPQQAESYTLNIEYGYNCHKGEMLETLIYEIRTGKLTFEKADARLKVIEEEPNLYVSYYLFVVCQ